MTNEEKAREIARDYKRPASSLEAEIACESALEMAQWKDQQFKEYLEKKRTDFPDFMGGTDAYAFGMKEGYVAVFNKIINEFFRGELNMTREKVIEFLIEDASKHNPEEVMHYIAGYRNDNGKDYYTWGEFLDSLKTQCGSVWEDCTKGTIDLLVNHPEFFKED